MNTDQIELFLDVAKTHSINQTAQHFYLTHQSASFALKKLEAELGLVLLNRTPNGVTLTEDGQAALEILQSIYEQFTNLKFMKQSSLHASITLQFPIIYTLISQNAMLDYTFLDRFPNIKLITQIMDNDAIIAQAAVPQESVISIFYTLTEASPLSASAAAFSQCFYQDQLCAIVNDMHPLSRKKAFTANDIDNYPLAVYHPYAESLASSASFFGLTVNTGTIAYTPSTLNALVHVVKRSNAIAPLPALIMRSMTPAERSAYSVAPFKPTLPIYWWYAYSSLNPAPIKDMLNRFIKDTLSYSKY